MSNPERISLTISQLNQEVGQLLHRGFPALWVEGEISNLARPASGHLYFSLKDASAQVKCAMFRAKMLGLNLRPENGNHVLAYGRVALYEPRGDYQFIIERMEALGEGELQRRFEALKRRLQEAGWFDPDSKRPLPPYPRCIGVITSPSGAAIRDILQVLRRRSPHIPVLIYPVAVQGDSAAPQLVRAIQQANRETRCDVLILARGGGSLEDLWPFNEESVGQAVHSSQLPIISGVGHEIDFTIVDFVADRRAPTPSAAAELASPDQALLRTQLQHLYKQCAKQVLHKLQRKQAQLIQLTQRLYTQQPARKIQQQTQRLDELDYRLRRAIQGVTQQNQTRLQYLTQRIHRQSPQYQLTKYQQTLSQQAHKLSYSMQQYLAQQQKSLALQAARLQLLSPLATLERGYALVFDEQGNLVKAAERVTAGQTLQIQLAQGKLHCRVN